MLDLQSNAIGSLKDRQAHHKRNTQIFYLGKPQGRKPNKFFCIDSSLSAMSDKYRKPKDKITSVTSSSSSPLKFSFSLLEWTCLWLLFPNEGECLPIYNLNVGYLKT